MESTHRSSPLLRGDHLLAKVTTLILLDRDGHTVLPVDEDRFVEESASLIEILVMVARKDEARKAAGSLRKFVEGEDIAVRLDNALDAAMKKKPPQKSPEAGAENNAKNHSQPESKR